MTTAAPEEANRATLDDALLIIGSQYRLDGTSGPSHGFYTVFKPQPVESGMYPVAGSFSAVRVVIQASLGVVSVNPFYFAARTDMGTNLQPTASPVNNMLPMTELPQGQQVAGWLTFDVPKGQHIAEIILSDPLGKQLGRWTAK